MRRIAPYYLIIIIIMLSGCLHTTQPDLTKPSTSQFVEYSVKIVNSIDITCDSIYSIFSQLYKDGKISETDKDKLIAVGKVLRQSLALSREAISAYIYAEQINQNQEDAKQRIKNTIAISLKTFYQFKDDAEVLYKSLTGKDLEIPSIPMFDTVVNLFINEGN